MKSITILRSIPNHLSTVYSAILLSGLALLSRWPFIMRGETLLHSDEAVVGCMAQDIANGLRWPIYFYGQSYMGALEAYLMAALRLLTNNPILSLRLTPAIFFSLLVGLQYLLLARWFNRSAALLGVSLLVFAPPALTQWSVAPRGAYIEVLVWGALFWLAYNHWFVEKKGYPTRGLFVSGLILGSGLWLNPAMIMFAAPCVTHAILNHFGTLQQILPKAIYPQRLGILALPTVLIATLVGLSILWSVQFDEAGPRHVLFYNLLPQSITFILIISATLLMFTALWRQQVLQHWPAAVRSAKPFIMGSIVGLGPMLLYLVLRAAKGLPAEGSLPLAPRAPWELGETLAYLWHGIPVLFSSNANLFLTMAELGRPVVTTSLSTTDFSLLNASDIVIALAAIGVGSILIIGARDQLVRILKLEVDSSPPITIILHGTIGYLCFYLMSAAAINFTSIRYLVPLWGFIPGLAAAAVFYTPWPKLTRIFLLLIATGWLFGQVLFWERLGAPHPLKPLAARLATFEADPILAEIFDVHLLRFLSDQKVNLVEFAPFWPRFQHHRPPNLDSASQLTYLIQISDYNLALPWFETNLPGEPPVETTKTLLPTVTKALADGRTKLIKRHRLGIHNYELWTLSPPLIEALQRR